LEETTGAGDTEEALRTRILSVGVATFKLVDILDRPAAVDGWDLVENSDATNSAYKNKKHLR
jgi:hypothetical protein